MAALTTRGVPVFGAAAPFLTADGRRVVRIGSGTTGLTEDGEHVFGLPALAAAATVFRQQITSHLRYGSRPMEAA